MPQLQVTVALGSPLEVPLSDKAYMCISSFHSLLLVLVSLGPVGSLPCLIDICFSSSLIQVTRLFTSMSSVPQDLGSIICVWPARQRCVGLFGSVRQLLHFLRDELTRVVWVWSGMHSSGGAMFSLVVVTSALPVVLFSATAFDFDEF